MDQNQLLSSAVELGLDLLEANGLFLPYCRAVNAAGEKFIYSASSSSGRALTESEASESVRANVLRDLGPRALVGVAFCHQSRIRFADEVEKVSAIEVELHFRNQKPLIWYFRYEVNGKKAKVLEYYTQEAKEVLFANG